MLKKLITVITLCASSLAFGAADANKASENELTTVKGIGPGIAAKIIQAREQGPFKNWDDLIARVDGIAANNAQKFSAQGLTINGQAIPSASKPEPLPAAKSNEKSGKSSNPS